MRRGDVILETIVTTCSPAGAVHVAPMGIRAPTPDRVILSPFRPSTTLENVLASGTAAVNMTDDVRVFAGCLTGRREWPVVPCTVTGGVRLAAALAHTELRLERTEEDPQRPRLHCLVVHEAVHGRFRGFNRAQAAVIEAAILVSRLHLLPAEKIDAELAWLAIAVEKTAGDAEREAWSWLLARIGEHRGAVPERR